MSDNTTNTHHKSSKAPAIAAAVILGAIALTPVAVKSFGNNPEVAKIGSSTTKNTVTTSSITDKSPEINKVGYSVGYILGNNTKQDASDLNVADIQQGFSDAYESKKTALTPEQMEQAITTYLKNKDAQAKQAQQTQSVEATKNLQAGQAFLAENGKKAGIKTTASGLQYEVLKEGTGVKPKATDTVSVKYEGKTLDGKVFDSTDKHGGKPVEFMLNEVIPGWTEGVQLMSEGAKYRFYIPSNLAYGEQGVPQGGIPANSVLIFDIELLKILPASAKAQSQQMPSAEEQAAMQAKIQEMMQQDQNQAQTTTTTQTTQTTTEPAK